MINYHFLSSSLFYSMRLQTFWDQAQWSSHRVWGLPGGKGSLWKNIFRWLNSPHPKGCPWEPRLFKKVCLHKPNHQRLCSSWAAPVLIESPKLALAIHDILSLLSPQPRLLRHRLGPGSPGDFTALPGGWFCFPPHPAMSHRSDFYAVRERPNSHSSSGPQVSS